jgi:hypothetical protein
MTTFLSSDLMHERKCERDGCNTIFYCVCGRMAHHEISTDLNYCGLHRREPDPRYDPDDEADQGGGIGGVSTLGPYSRRFLRI